LGVVLAPTDRLDFDLLPVIRQVQRAVDDPQIGIVEMVGEPISFDKVLAIDEAPVTPAGRAPVSGNQAQCICAGRRKCWYFDAEAPPRRELIHQLIEKPRFKFPMLRRINVREAFRVQLDLP
jgi:hypothetical protein